MKPQKNENHHRVATVLAAGSLELEPGSSAKVKIGVPTVTLNFLDAAFFELGFSWTSYRQGCFTGGVSLIFQPLECRDGRVDLKKSRYLGNYNLQCAFPRIRPPNVAPRSV